MSTALVKMPIIGYKMSSILQRLGGKGVSGTQVLQGAKSGNPATVVNDTKSGMVDVAEETYDTLQEMVQVGCSELSTCY